MRTGVVTNVVTKYIISKAFKQNAFKLNNKKIERFSTF